MTDVVRKCCSCLACLGVLSLASAQDMPAFQGARVPVTGRPEISRKSQSYLCDWHRKSGVLRKDMYAGYPDISRTERISILQNSDETIITHNGTGTFGDFSTKAVINEARSVKFDTPSLIGASDKKIFVFGRAVSTVFAYWGIAVSPGAVSTGIPDSAKYSPLVSAVSLLIGTRRTEEEFAFEITGIDMSELYFVEEKNGYLLAVNRSVAKRCVLNKKYAKQDCVTNIYGWVLFDKETGIVIEQDLVFTLLAGDGLSSVPSATWRDKLTCRRVSSQ